MRIPIACTLTETDAVDRVGEWRSFLRECVRDAERTERELRLQLDDGESVLLRAADIAGREKACCGFFTFAIEIDVDTRTLVIGVPPDAGATLDGLSDLLNEGQAVEPYPGGPSSAPLSSTKTARLSSDEASPTA